MNRSKKAELEREIDELALKWKSIPQEGNEAEACKLRCQLWCKCYALLGYPSTEEEIARAAETSAFAHSKDTDVEDSAFEALLEALSKYDPRKGAFSHYLFFLRSNRTKDRFRKNERHAPGDAILDAPISDENSTIFAEYIAGGGMLEQESLKHSPEKQMEMDLLFADLCAIVLNFAERHKGPSANAARRMWYKLFLTEDMTFIIKHHEIRFLHERDVFEAMDLSYLDYYLQDICRTYREIRQTPLKPYCEVVPKSTQTAETAIPLPAEVSLNYLRRCKGITAGASARSMQMKFYKEEKAEIYAKR